MLNDKRLVLFIVVLSVTKTEFILESLDEEGKSAVCCRRLFYITNEFTTLAKLPCKLVNRALGWHSFNFVPNDTFDWKRFCEYRCTDLAFNDFIKTLVGCFTDILEIKKLMLLEIINTQRSKLEDIRCCIENSGKESDQQRCMSMLPLIEAKPNIVLLALGVYH
jgi:hypothetical protein